MKKVWTADIVRTISNTDSDKDITLNSYIELLQKNCSKSEFDNFIGHFQQKAAKNNTNFHMEIIKGIKRVKGESASRRIYSLSKFNDLRVLEDWIEGKGNSRRYKWRQDYIDVPTFRVEGSDMELLEVEVNDVLNLRIVYSVLTASILAGLLTFFIL